MNGVNSFRMLRPVNNLMNIHHSTNDKFSPCPGRVFYAVGELVEVSKISFRLISFSTDSVHVPQLFSGRVIYHLVVYFFIILPFF